MRKLLLFTLLVLFISVAGCQKSGRKFILTNKLNKYVSQEIIHILEEPDVHEVMAVQDIRPEVLPLVQDFYEKNEFQPVWLRKRKLTNQGEDLLELLNQSRNYGLDTSWYPVTAINSYFLKDKNKIANDTMLAQADVLLTYSYMIFGAHLHAGILNRTDLKPQYMLDTTQINMRDRLEKALDDKDVVKSLLKLQPQTREYAQLQSALEKFLNANALTNKPDFIPDADSMPTEAEAKAKEMLIKKKYLGEKAKGKNDYKEALTKFQKINGLAADGKLSAETRRALVTTNYDLYLQAALNLQRWRWEPLTDTEYVFINIPGFSLKVINEGQIVREHRVIVGKIESQTPELSSSITYFVVNPFWSVPRSIATEELLPKIKQNPGYLASKHYRLLDNSGNEVDPSSVNWKKITVSNFNYMIRRDPGSFNDLGQIKFMFPNRFSVYLHDTPSKNLFVKDVRGYSHGCIRLENPLDFGGFMLERDEAEMTRDDIQALVDAGTQKTVVLKKPLAIHIKYFTSAGDDDGTLHSYPDIYNRDQKLLQLIVKNQQPLPL